VIEFKLVEAPNRQAVPQAPFHEWTFPDGAPWARFFRTGHGYRVEFHELADFDVSANGLKVTCCLRPKVADHTADHLFLNQVLPLALSRQGHLVFHASGNAAGLGTALTLAGEEATVLELSWYGEGPVAASLGGAFHSRRLRLVSSQVGRIAPSHRPRWTHGRRLAAALALLADARLDALLAPAIPFQDLPRLLPHILDASRGVLCQSITYP